MKKKQFLFALLAAAVLPLSFTAAGCTPAVPAASAVYAQKAEQAKPSVFPDKKVIDGVIFDMDGTLIDSLGAWDGIAVKYLRSRGIEPPPDIDKELIPLSLLEGAALLKERFNLPGTPEEILADAVAPVRQRYLTDIPLKKGVRELLENLQAQGIKMCVATASDKEFTLAVFKRLDILKYFEFVITCDEVGAGKRTPKVYDVALEKLGTEKARTLVVEDAPHAVQTAHRAGYPTLAIADPYYSVEKEEIARQAADYFLTTFEIKK